MRAIMIITFFLLVNISKSSGQSSGSYNMWYQYFLSAKVSSKSNIIALGQYRSYDFIYDTRLFLGLTYVDYEIVKGVRPALGFMYLLLRSYPEDDQNLIRYEKRPFQQVTLAGDIGRVGINHRFRAEERFLNNPDQFILRLRYLISINIPFYKVGQDEKFYGIFKNEIRVNVRNERAFDSNRITGGVGWRLSKKWAIEANLVAQLDEGSSSNYGAIVARNFLDWRKKNKNQ